MMVIMMPFFFLAMYEKNGQPLEVFLNQFIQANFVRPKYRPYETDNHYATIMRQIEAQKEVERIVQFSKERQGLLQASPHLSNEESTLKRKKQNKKIKTFYLFFKNPLPNRFFCDIMFRSRGGIAQLVEYRSPKPWVAGSNPPAPAKKKAIRVSEWLFSVKFVPYGTSEIRWRV